MTSAVSFENLANIIKQQLAGPLDEWIMPWHSGIAEPYNPISGHTYTGNNAITLINAAHAQGFQSAQWATLRAWSKKGIRLIKGAKATKIHVPNFKRARPTQNTTQHTNQKTGETSDHSKRRGFRTLSVFNGDQLGGYNEHHPDMFDPFQHKPSVEFFITQCKASINFHNGNAY